jgi:hypothetical protein
MRFHFSLDLDYGAIRVYLLSRTFGVDGNFTCANGSRHVSAEIRLVRFKQIDLKITSKILAL